MYRLTERAIFGIELGSPEQEVVLFPGDGQDLGFRVQIPEDLRANEVQAGRIKWRKRAMRSTSDARRGSEAYLALFQWCRRERAQAMDSGLFRLD